MHGDGDEGSLVFEGSCDAVGFVADDECGGCLERGMCQGYAGQVGAVEVTVGGEGEAVGEVEEGAFGGAQDFFVEGIDGVVEKDGALESESSGGADESAEVAGVADAVADEEGCFCVKGDWLWEGEEGGDAVGGFECGNFSEEGFGKSDRVFGGESGFFFL